MMDNHQCPIILKFKEHWSCFDIRKVKINDPLFRLSSNHYNESCHFYIDNIYILTVSDITI